MQDYNAALEAFHAKDTEVVALSPMTEAQTAALAGRLGLGFPILSDLHNAYARRLDLLFEIEPAVREIYMSRGLSLPEYDGDESWELPVTAVFVTDENRRVLYAWTESDYTQRPDPEELLAALD